MFKSKTYFAFVDGSSYNLMLIVDKEPSALYYLVEMYLDSIVFKVTATSPFIKLFYKLLIFSKHKYLFKYSMAKRRFVFCSDEGQVAEFKNKYPVVFFKFHMIKRLLHSLESRLDVHNKEFNLDYVVYPRKLQEAEKFRELGYPEDKKLDFPYIYFESIQKKLSGKEVATSILNKANMYHFNLAKSEATRQIYMQNIANAKTKEDLLRVFRNNKLNIL